MSVGSRPYEIVPFSEDHPAVDLWSSVRLPFEPKGWVRDVRNELRDALRELHADDDYVLHALYVSTESGMFDVENVLFYNVGAECFSRAIVTGVRFERAQVPSMPESKHPGLNHFHQYTLVPRESGFATRAETRSVASWSTPTRPLIGAVNAASVWWVVRTGEVRTTEARPSSTSTLELRLRIHTPPGVAPKVVNLIKPLIDGVMSALHVHDGSDTDELATRIGRLADAPSSEIGRHLTDDSRATLGRRRLLWRWRDSVQWNPADDRLTACEVLVVEGSRWELSGELCEVFPVEEELQLDSGGGRASLVRLSPTSE